MDGEKAVLGLLGGLALYKAGQAPKEWQDLQQQVDDRIERLEYTETGVPVGFYENVANAEKLHSEAIGTYLLGYHNASIPMSFRCLEVSMSERYEELEGKEPDMSSYKLLKHFDDTGVFEENPLNLQWFRKQRNKIHTNELIEEVDALEAIRHTTMGINELYPHSGGVIGVELGCCGKEYDIDISNNAITLGTTVEVECSDCNQETSATVLPNPLASRV